MMKILLLALLLLVSSKKIIEYKFSQNFGLVFFDYSENKNRAINGESATKPQKSTQATDRGAFFYSSDSTITLPPNTLIDSFSLPAQFTIVFWSLVKDNSFYVLQFSGPNLEIYLRRFVISQVLAFRVKTDEFDTEDRFSNKLQYSSSKWNLVTFAVGTSVKLFINNELADRYEIGNGLGSRIVSAAKFGVKDLQTSFMGFVYNFIVSDVEEDYTGYLGPASSECLTGTCKSCEFSILDDGLQGCLSKEEENFCPNCFGKCTDGNCLACNSCKEKTCILDDSTVLCKCPLTSTANQYNCSCEAQMYFNGTSCNLCLDECDKCLNSSHCQTCFSLNSVNIKGRCQCEDGYYNISLLNTKTSCISCGPGCNKCSPEGLCLSCIDTNANASNSCLCNKGFFYSKGTCKSCFYECEECKEYGPCTLCKSMNAWPSTFGCKCMDGYGSKTSLVLPDSCHKCHDDCLACSQSGACDACKDENSRPDTEGCYCVDGFFKSGGVCLPCNKECKTCNETDCIECWDENAWVSGNGCFCPEGYYDKVSVEVNYTRCGACHRTCRNCTNPKTCISCLYQNAIKLAFGCECPARSYINGKSCENCQTWSESLNSCILCNKNQYFSDEKCINCPNLCLTCNKSQCFTCKPDAFLVNSSCICRDYYEGESECQPSIFYFNAKFEEPETIISSFSLPLMDTLDTEDYVILVNDQKIGSKLLKISESLYSIIMDGFEYNNKMEITLEFQEKVVSILNTTLEERFVKLILSAPKVYKSDSNTKQDIMVNTQSTLYITLSITVFLSIINFNIVSIWSFLNMMQLVLYIRLINISLPNKFNYMLIALKDTPNIFNIFDYFISEDSFSNVTGRWVKFGYKTSSILINYGYLITLFFLINISMILAYLLKKLTIYKPFSYSFIQKRIYSYWMSFRYDEFLRFYIQSYLDLAIGSFAGMKYGDSMRLIEFFDYLVSIVIFSLAMLTPLIAFIFINKRKNLVLSHNPGIIQKYGSLFYEFSYDKNLLITFFYFFFFTRRALIALALLLLMNYPIAQLMLLEILGIFVIVIQMIIYLIKYRPYSECLITVMNVLCESIICLILAALAIINISKNEKDLQSLDESFVAFIYTIFITQTLVPLFISIRNIILYCRSKCGSSKVEPATDSKTTEKDFQNITRISDKSDRVITI